MSFKQNTYRNGLRLAQEGEGANLNLFFDANDSPCILRRKECGTAEPLVIGSTEEVPQAASVQIR